MRFKNRIPESVFSKKKAPVFIDRRDGLCYIVEEIRGWEKKYAQD